MQIGMSWYVENPKQAISEAVREAAEFYLAKYGQQATECWVNPADLATALTAQIGPIRVVGSRSIIRRHLWIGVGKTIGVSSS